MKNNDNEQYLISDGKLHVQGLGHRQLKKHFHRFVLSESGNGLNYSASIQELQTDEDYLVTFHGKMPLESLTFLLWELHNGGDDQRTVTAYTNCNRYGLPANAMLCMNDNIDDAEPIAVDNQGHVYIYDYESKLLNYKLTDKTAGYTSCPRTRTVEKESITVTASEPGLIQLLRLKFKFPAFMGGCSGGAQDVEDVEDDEDDDDVDEPGWCLFLQLAFWIAFLPSSLLSDRMELPKLFYFLDYYLFTNLTSGLIILFIFFVLCAFLRLRGYIKLGPFTILAIIGSPFVFSILANYYITPEQRERTAIITDKAVGDDSNWIEWRYTDDNSSFGTGDDIHDQIQVGDTCIVDWRQGVMGWPVVRGIVKK